jgi:hypothetical protein
MLPVVGQLVQLLNAFGALLWATTLAVAGYLLGKVLELVFGDLAAVANPLFDPHCRPDRRMDGR